MRRMDFTTEHVESFQPGETYEVTECVLPSSYYYVLEHALGISKNFDSIFGTGKCYQNGGKLRWN